jgi:hypothetical protein
MSSHISVVACAHEVGFKITWFQEAVIDELMEKLVKFKLVLTPSSIIFLDEALKKLKKEYDNLIKNEPDTKEFILCDLENPVSILISELRSIKHTIPEVNEGTKTLDEIIKAVSSEDDNLCLDNIYLIYIVSAIRYILKEWTFTNRLGIWLMEQLHELGCGTLVRETFLCVSWDWNIITKIHLAMFVGTIDFYLPMLLNHIAEDNMTPLMRAIHIDAEINIGRLILHLGADIFIRNRMGLNAIDLTVILMNFKYLKLIMSYVKTKNLQYKINTVQIFAAAHSIKGFKITDEQRREIIRCLI